MSFQNSSFSEDDEPDTSRNNSSYKNDKISYMDYKEKESDKKNKSLIKVEMNIGDGIIKELNIYKLDEIDKSINDFCIENNLPKESKAPIKDLLLQEINKKITQCKLYLI